MRLRQVALAVLTIAACGGSTQPSDLKVTSFTPQGAIEKAEPVEIRFDKPAVAEDAVGKPADPTVVTIEPRLGWKGFWQDRQTLVIEPTESLAPSTRYRVALAGELARRAASFELAFVHRPLAVEGIWGADAESLATDGDVPVSFNQEVRSADAAKHCKLTGSDGDIALVAKDDEKSTTITLQPASKLVAGTRYTLVCDGLAGAGGNATLDTPYSLAVRARPLPAVLSITPAGNDIPADDVTLTVTFATPVSLDEARKAITSQPRIKSLHEGWLSGDGTEYKVTTDLETETNYTVTVNKLTDVHGQQLAKAFTSSFYTGDARPRLSMERGIFALEASAKGYPLWSRNIGKFEVECAQIPKDRIVEALTTDMNYDPWGGNSDSDEIHWSKLHVRAKTSQHKQTKKNKWNLTELDLPATCGGTSQRGVFLAEVRSDEIQEDPDRGWWAPRKNRVLANVTDLGVLLKVGTASGVVWVTSLSTGEPVANARVTLFTPQGKKAFSGATDADGLLLIPGSAVMKNQKPAVDPEESEYDWDSYRAQRMIATIEKDADLAVVDGNWANGIQIWNYGLPEDRSGGATRLRGFIQSDRGLYRPGESVHFKGLVREIAAGRAPSVPSQQRVEIEVQDSRGQTVMTTRTKLSTFGGFAWDLDLAQEASLGDYYVAATVAGQVFREKFSVEEFRPASYEVKLTPKDTAPKLGARLAFELDASYLFGAPVAKAKVEWSVRRRKHDVKFPGYDDYTFSANPEESYWWGYRNEDYGDQISDGSGVTSAQGHLTIATRDRASKLEGPQDYILTAAVTDSADQTIGKSTIVTMHKTGFYLGMHANEFVQAVGMPFGVNLVAIKPDGKRTTVKAKLTFTRTERSCTWESIGARSYQRCDGTPKQMFEREVEIAEGGSHTERINPTEPGDYIVRVEAKDAAGNVVTAASQIWVIGAGEAFWSGDEGDRMTLVASKQSYQPGETARLVAQANLVAPTALVTIERDGVIEARVSKMKSASEGVELLIKDAWAPNVFASVALVSGRHGDGDKNRPLFKMGIVQLVVSSTHKALDVAISLDAEKVRPGDKVTGKIKVTAAGQPVKAEVSLSVADEGVLQLIAYETPNPMKTFYASYGLGVDAATNWNRVARLADPESGYGDEGADMASANGQRIRSKFVSSAFWAPMLVTDELGEIPFSFTAPDNLTAFRLMAVAADIGDRFGAGEKRLTINKPLMAAPALPRFLRSGDSATVGVIVHNNTETAGTATVTAKASGASLGGGSRTVNVPAGGSARVRFSAKAADVTSATFEFAVAMNGEQDAVRVTLPVGKPRLVETRTLAERKLAPGEIWTGAIGAGTDVIRKESTLVITIDRSGVGDLAPSLRSLVTYPYGCLEQTMSKFVPLLAAKDLAKTLDDPSLQGTRMNQYIKAGVAKVMRHQQGDGLFSLWPQSQTYPHLAAYALWGLTVAQTSGVNVPNDVFDRGLRALGEWANGAGNLKPDGDGAVIAMAAYVMALRGKPDAALNARLFGIAKGLPKWGQAFLLRAMALAKADAKQLAELEQILVADVTVVDGKAKIHETGSRDELEHYFSSDVRATAMTIAALLDVDPKSQLIDPLVIGLKAERGRGGYWQTTQENVWSLVALSQYARRATGGSVTATVSVGGKQLAKRTTTGAEISVIRIPLPEGTNDAVTVSVDKDAHVSVRVTEARADAGASESHGFTVVRTYENDKGEQLKSFKAGELVTVSIDITADAEHRWVALVDPLPAGFEIVNPRLASGAGNLPQQTARSWWEEVTWDHQDMRDDQVQWFADRVRSGKYTLRYQARATIAGAFTAMPATIEAMYDPDVRGRSAKAELEIK